AVATCAEPQDCNITITVARADGRTYVGRYATGDSCARTVTTGNTAIILGDFGGRYADTSCAGATVAISMEIPGDVTAPGTFPQPPEIFGSSWVVLNAPFSDSGGYGVDSTGSPPSLTITAIDRTPGGRVQGTLTAPLVLSGTGDKATGTFVFDIVLT